MSDQAAIETVDRGGARGRLSGRRVLVTGAASGIGHATVERLGRDGAVVAAWDLTVPGDEVAARWLRQWVCDVSDEACVAAVMADTVAWLGGLDAVVHVAGVIAGAGLPVDELERGDWDSVLAVNLTGAYLVTRYATPHLEHAHGVLVLTGSGAGVFNGHPSVPYAASKAGLHGLALTLEEPLRARGVRVHDVAPGAVDTPLLRRQVSADVADQRRTARHLVSAESVAAIMAFLVSDDADAIRGTVRTW